MLWFSFGFSDHWMRWCTIYSGTVLSIQLHLRNVIALLIWKRKEYHKNSSPLRVFIPATWDSYNSVCKLPLPWKRTKSLELRQHSLVGSTSSVYLLAGLSSGFIQHYFYLFLGCSSLAAGGSLDSDFVLFCLSPGCYCFLYSPLSLKVCYCFGPPAENFDLI